MKFEEWGERLKQTGDEEDFQPINIAKLYTAWSNERGKLIGALEFVSNVLQYTLGADEHRVIKDQIDTVLAKVKEKS